MKKFILNFTSKSILSAIIQTRSKSEGGSYCQQVSRLSSRREETPLPGLQELTLQAAFFPISVKSSSTVSNKLPPLNLVSSSPSDDSAAIFEPYFSLFSFSPAPDLISSFDYWFHGRNANGEEPKMNLRTKKKKGLKLKQKQAWF